MPELPPPPAADAHVEPWHALRHWWEAQRARPRPDAGAVVAVLAAVVVGAVVWSAFARSAAPPPELSLPRVGSAGDPGADDAGGGGAASGEPASSSSAHRGAGGRRSGDDVVVAHVAGAVARPGVYRLASGARLSDAVDAAGGPTPEADVDAVNLAARLTDGERVYVPRRGEVPAGATVTGSPGGGAAVAVAGPLDLNTATADDLEQLPGVGPATAAAIVSYRQQHGRFASVDELLEVRGIGEAKLAAIRPKVRVR